MKMLNMTSWTYVGYACFPNIDNKNILKERGLDIEEDKSKVTYFYHLNILTFAFLQDDSD